MLIYQKKERTKSRAKIRVYNQCAPPCHDHVKFGIHNGLVTTLVSL